MFNGKVFNASEKPLSALIQKAESVCEKREAQCIIQVFQLDGTPCPPGMERSGMTWGITKDDMNANGWLIPAKGEITRVIRFDNLGDDDCERRFYYFIVG